MNPTGDLWFPPPKKPPCCPIWPIRRIGIWVVAVTMIVVLRLIGIDVLTAVALLLSAGYVTPEIARRVFDGGSLTAAGLPAGLPLAASSEVAPITGWGDRWPHKQGHTEPPEPLRRSEGGWRRPRLQ